MGFQSVCTAIYNYQAQDDGELELKEGDLLYILDKSSDDAWWKARKRVGAEDEDEPEGLIPNNYVEEVRTQASFIYMCELLNGATNPRPIALTPSSPPRS